MQVTADRPKSPVSRSQPTSGGGYLSSSAGLLLILAAAAALRLWGINHGLPFVYLTDEIMEVKRALQLGAGHFDYDRAFKGGLFYLLFVGYGALFAVWRLAGEIRSTGDYLFRFAADPTPFWMIGRVTVALIAIVNIFLVYRLGKKLGDRRVGILSALFLCFALDHHTESQSITVDVLMVTLLTATFLYLVEIERMGRRRDYLLTSLFAALAVMTKLPAIVVLLPILLAHVRRTRGEGLGAAAALTDRRFLFAICLFLGVTAIGNPGFFEAFVRAVEVRLGLLSEPTLTQSAEPFRLRTTNVWVYYVRAMGASMSPLIFAAALPGLVVGLWRRDRAAISIALFCFVFYLFICVPQREDHVYPRYTLPVQMLLSVVAARFLVSIGRGLPHGRLGTGVRALAPLLLIVPGALQIVRYDMTLTRTDTRTLAKRWIEENIPAGSRILVKGSGYRPSPDTVALWNTAENVEAHLNRLKGDDPRWRETSRYSRRKDSFHIAHLSVARMREGYDLAFFGSDAFPYRSLDEYLDMGVEYIVIDRVEAQGFLNEEGSGRFPEVMRFYERVGRDPRLELIREFTPRGNPGPALELYRVREGPDVGG
ncbi:MAG: phospholipid carrier-dependent glycosyltransferase [Candidatus Eisenbacteria bacterium]|nr:phospholipid carrier-dependent glycosyltransferase [Candidatus Eisenbacteria bacterium]